MRKVTLAISMALSAMSMAWAASPAFVGHRGSLYGVENTREAFINGAERGYEYLECDLRLTADSVLVLSHDENTKRLGGNLTVAEATYEQLCAETYSQTRDGVTYTGQIATVDEYLDICCEYGVVPVIELKWSTGINNNDQSCIPLLVAVLELKGVRSDCVILTSMRNCLDYIRQKYPDIPVQFLAKEDVEEQFNWAVEKEIDVDVRRDCINADLVKRFHDAGRTVNVWTVNDPTQCQQLIEMGVDLITTDSLNPQQFQK